MDSLEASLAHSYGMAVAPGILRRSIARGLNVADHIFQWSRADRGHEAYLNDFPPYTPPVGPGLWVPTPPGFLPGLQPYWGSNRTFALASGGACDPGPPLPYSEDRSSAFYREALECSELVTDLTREQEAIARFWSDDPGVRRPHRGTPSRSSRRSSTREGSDWTWPPRPMRRWDRHRRRIHLLLEHEIPIQLASTGYLHPPRHRSEVEFPARHAAVPRVHLGSLRPVGRGGTDPHRSLRHVPVYRSHPRRSRPRPSFVPLVRSAPSTKPRKRLPFHDSTGASTSGPPSHWDSSRACAWAEV
jgi:hypothetical protein